MEIISLYTYDPIAVMEFGKRKTLKRKDFVVTFSIERKKRTLEIQSS